jgi:2,4-dienoyl-CoA reductase-like NADH-dependent reductase (Old Yellow Enzyme family)
MDNMGSGGEVTEAQLNLYRDLARGEIGLIISSGIFPSPEGQAGAGQLGVHSDDMIPSSKKIPTVVHENGRIHATDPAVPECLPCGGKIEGFAE